MPTIPGTYTLTATAAASGGPMTFNAAVSALSIQLLGTPAAAVDGIVEPPSVMVRDESGSPMPGVVVTFATVSGGSVLSASVVVANSVGVATLGSCRHGPTPTMKIVEARA